MMLKDLLQSCRSYRSFDPACKVSEDTLRTLVDAARFTASTINLQVLKFRPVTAQTECDGIRANTRWGTKVKDIIALPPKGHEAPAYLVICTDRDVHPSADTFLIDVGIAAEAIMLAATEMGLGGCMMSSFSKSELPKILALPENLTPQLVLAIGKPDEKVVIDGPAPDGSVTYYRKDGVHVVQKRNLDDLIIKK